MVNVLVNTDELTVIGSLDTVEVQVDYGQKGDRGTNIYVGQGLPSTATGGTLEGISVIDGDLYINTLTSDMYKLSNAVTQVWEKLYKLGEIAYSKSYSVDFVDGVGELSLAFGDIFDPTDTSLTAGQIVVQYQITGRANPLATTVSKTVVTNGDNTKSLELEFKAIEFDWTTFESSKLTATAVKVDVLITVAEGA